MFYCKNCLHCKYMYTTVVKFKKHDEVLSVLTQLNRNSTVADQSFIEFQLFTVGFKYLYSFFNILCIVHIKYFKNLKSKKKLTNTVKTTGYKISDFFTYRYN